MIDYATITIFGVLNLLMILDQLTIMVIGRTYIYIWVVGENTRDKLGIKASRLRQLTRNLGYSNKIKNMFSVAIDPYNQVWGWGYNKI